MAFSKIMSATVELELVSACLERTLLVLNAEGIEILDYRQTDFLTGRFRIRQRELKRTMQICAYMDGVVKVLNKYGIYWVILSVLRRPLLLLGIAGILAFYCFIPSRILFVRVEGNSQVPARKIQTEAQTCGLFFGASRKEVRSEKVKNTLLERIPQLQWAGVNTEGCVAIISVRERQMGKEKEMPGNVSSLAASRDGYVLAATATKGTLLVQPGQTVVEGQLLISGFTDCGIRIRAEAAQGEIYAQTNRNLQVLAPAIREQRVSSGKVMKKISLIIGKKRINLWKDSGISIDTCGRMYEEYYMTLPGGFQLPAALCIETFSPYHRIPSVMPLEEAVSSISDAACLYLEQQMIAGRIIRRDESVFSVGNAIMLTGSYVCQEMISGVRLEQIGEINGENN